MKPRIILLIFALVVIAVAGALYLMQAPGLQTEAAFRGDPDAAKPAVAERSACSDLTGHALERCRLQVWYSSEPRTYDKGPDNGEINASAAGARGVRGSGVEGVTSGGTTHAPPR